MSISKKTAKSSGKMRSDAGAAWGFLSPWIIGFLIFSAFPLAFSFYLSLTKWNLMGDPQFVGLQNYKDMLSGNGELGQTLLATAIFTVINVSVSILFPCCSLFCLISRYVSGDCSSSSTTYRPSCRPWSWRDAWF